MSSMLTVSVVLLLALTSVVNARPCVPAIYVFGDSSVDVGNNNYLPGNALSKANFNFNGIDYPGGVPTGRFSNGFIGIDFAAQRLGFEKSPPAALSINHTTQELYGVNYASGGSGIFDTTGQNVSLSMNKQIKLFENTVVSLIRHKGKQQTGVFLSKSMFFVSTATNDMFKFFTDTGAQNHTLKAYFISSLESKFKNQLKKLYNLGARKFAIFGNAMAGCAPGLRVLSPSRDCNEALNDLSRDVNNATTNMLTELKSKLPGMKYSFAKVYEVNSYILANPNQFGFKEVKEACCGVGLLRAQAPCTPNATYCSNRNEYLIWDYGHPTEATYKVIVDFAFHASSKFVGPVNFRQLSLL